MRILIFNWRDIKNPAAGGAEVFTHEIAKRLVSKGHRICLFTSAFKGCEKNEIIDGLEIVRSGGRFTVYLKAQQYYKKHSGEYDVVIDEINTKPFMTPKFVKDGTPIIALIYQLAREFWFLETPFPVSWIGYHLLEDQWLKKYRNIPTLTISHSTKEDLINLGFKKVTIVPIGLNIHSLSEVPEKEDTPTFIFLGRMGHAKCPDHVLAAFQHIKREIPDARLWMVGNGAMRQKLENKKIDGVTFFGYVSSEKKLKFLSRAHAILVPGVREGWGLVVTEANAMGTPAIAYDVHGLRDSVKDGKTGLLTESNPESMAKEVLRFFEDDDLRDRLTHGALKDAGDYDWDKSAEETLKIIEALE